MRTPWIIPAILVAIGTGSGLGACGREQPPPPPYGAPWAVLHAGAGVSPTTKSRYALDAQATRRLEKDAKRRGPMITRASLLLTPDTSGETGHWTYAWTLAADGVGELTFTGRLIAAEADSGGFAYPGLLLAADADAPRPGRHADGIYGARWLRLTCYRAPFAGRPLLLRLVEGPDVARFSHAAGLGVPAPEADASATLDAMSSALDPLRAESADATRPAWAWTYRTYTFTTSTYALASKDREVFEPIGGRHGALPSPFGDVYTVLTYRDGRYVPAMLAQDEVGTFSERPDGPTQAVDLVRTALAPLAEDGWRLFAAEVRERTVLDQRVGLLVVRIRRPARSARDR